MEDDVQATEESVQVQRESVSDAYRVTPFFVSGMSISQRHDSRLMLLAFFSGMPLQTGPNQFTLRESLIASFALDTPNARFLYENLKEFLRSIGEEV